MDSKLNKFFNSNSKILSKSKTKPQKPQKRTQKKQQKQTQIFSKNVLKTFYILRNTLQIHLIQYDDPPTKNILKDKFNNLQLIKPNPKTTPIHDNLNKIFTTFDNIYNQQRDLLKQLKFKDLPGDVRYATEDMTRGLAKFISMRYSTTLPHFKISNAFTKLWECLSVFNLIPSNTENYKVFHICEAPGQMILAAKYFAEKKYPNITNYDWRANSLNPFNAEVKRIFGSVFSDEYKLMSKYPKKWLWGDDNTGDITRVKNIKWFKTYIDKWLSNSTKKFNKSNKPTTDNPDKLNLIIGDGGLSAESDAFILQKLDLAQVIVVLSCSSIDGHCIIKHFTPFMVNHPETKKSINFYISLLYLYYLAFENVSLFKPYSSDMTSGEFYVIGKGFKGIDDTSIQKCYDILKDFKLNCLVMKMEDMPETFINQIINFFETMTEYNMAGYEKQIALLRCLTNSSKTITNTNSTSSNTSLCKNFLNSNSVEQYLVPRYNKWIDIYEFE